MPSKDPEKRKEICRKYYETHKEKIKEQSKRYYHENKERVTVIHKKWENNNKEKVKDYRRSYHEAHREKRNNESNIRNKQCNEESKVSADNHRQLWTPEDIVILEKMLAQNKTHKEIAERLGRTINAVRRRIILLRKNGDSFNGNPVDI